MRRNVSIIIITVAITSALFVGVMLMPSQPFSAGPDDSTPQYLVATPISDNAEVYNRLLGFSSMDGLGRAFYFDNFSQGLSRWTITGRVGGVSTIATAPKLSTTYNTGVISPVQIGGAGFASSQAMQFQVGSQASDNQFIQNSFYLGGSKILGFETAVLFPSGIPGEMYFETDYKLSSTQSYVAQIKLNTDNWSTTGGKFQVLNVAGGGYTDIPGAIIKGISGYIQIKIVADFNTGIYKRLIIGETSYDLSGFGLTPGAPSLGVGQSVWYLSAYWHTGVTVPVYIGYLLLTRDEPA